MEVRLATFESPDGSQRVVLCRRIDGNFTYRMQFADPNMLDGPDFVWGRPGPDCGVYDTIETAEAEAMQRVAWLKLRFN
ncbi:MAG: hypothetical protein MUE77_11825 [Sandarakinorhabdus sp.]|jgi:hypothetical protein|nr:hypothetical protein [Sandarakinorhabdus sp.]